MHCNIICKKKLRGADGGKPVSICRMKRLLQSEISRTSIDCCAAHCSICTDGCGISVPIFCRAATSFFSDTPLRAISAMTAFVRGTKLAGCWSEASIGTNSGASSPTSLSPADGRHSVSAPKFLSKDASKTLTISSELASNKPRHGSEGKH